jgi:transcriptional activator SPT7
MRRKTERLMSRVPNISIKEIKTDLEEEGDDMSEEDDHEPERVSRKSSGKHMVSIERKTTPVQVDRRSRERSMTRGSSAAPLSAMEAAFGSDIENALTPDAGTPHMQYGGKHVKKSGDEDENIDLEQEEKKLGAEIDADMGEFQDQVWRDKTKKTRAKLTVCTNKSTNNRKLTK